MSKDKFKAGFDLVVTLDEDGAVEAIFAKDGELVPLVVEFNDKKNMDLVNEMIMDGELHEI